MGSAGSSGDVRYKLALLLEPHGVRHCNGTSMLDQEPRTELPESHLHLLRAHQADLRRNSHGVSHAPTWNPMGHHVDLSRGPKEGAFALWKPAWPPNPTVSEAGDVEQGPSPQDYELNSHVSQHCFNFQTLLQ